MDEIHVNVIESYAKIREEAPTSSISLPKESVYRRRFSAIPWKLKLISASLFFGGFACLIWGVICVFLCDHFVAKLVVGGIMLVPGLYSAVVLVNYIRGVHGFHWAHLPEVN
eukprot:RCo042094